MSEYLRKNAVLEWLHQKHEKFLTGGHLFEMEAIEQVIAHIQSGAFDADESEGTWKATAEVLGRENAQMNSEVQHLRTALEFYADSRKYHISEKYSGGEFIGSWAEICGDSGNVARRALKEGRHE